ncbi:hypothetical protein V4U86_19155 [Mycobacterium sp. AMU20-3851]|uniref:hypothetical protein n=1 Tax=Mycobacterium sp. AMU20-3851 TaxID=3122055 RepID=UPI00375438E0
MKPYRAIGRQGAGVVRLFDSPMTHAVDVDGSIERYFTSESEARDFAFEMSLDGRDAVVVAATPCDRVPTDALTLQGLFSERLGRLFETVTSPDGKPYEHDDLANALHEEGIPLASRVVDRLLSGIGGQPPEKTIAAVARFFGIAPEALGGRSTGAGPTESDNEALVTETTVSAVGVYAKARNNDPAVPFNARKKPFKSGRGYAVDLRVRDYNGAAAKRYAEGVIIGFWESEQQARRVADEVNSGKRFEPGHHLHSRAHSAIVVPAWNVSDTAVFPWETAEGSAEMAAAYEAAGVPLPQWLSEILSRIEVPSRSLGLAQSNTSPEHDAVVCGSVPKTSGPRPVSMRKDLLEAIRRAVEVGEIVSTLGTSCPNRVVSIDESGIRVATEKSERKGSEPQLVPAWMIQTAWDHLIQHGDLTQKQLVDELNVKRSAFICALLSRLPDVEYESVPRVSLRLARDEDAIEIGAWGEVGGGAALRPQYIAEEPEGDLRNLEPDDGRPDGYADRLNRLFETVHPDDRGSFSSEEVAAALQADGISLHANSISRLREGIGAPPQETATHALAYFFNVDPDYLFSASTASFDAASRPPTRQGGPPNSRSSLDREGDSAASRSHGDGAGAIEDVWTDKVHSASAIDNEQVSAGLRLSTADLLRLSAGLSQAAHAASRRPHTDLGLIRRFVTLIAEAADFLQKSIGGDVAIPVRYLEHALVEWDQTEPEDNGTDVAFRWLAELLNSHIDS